MSKQNMELQGIDVRSSGRKVIAALLLIGLTIFLVRLIAAPWIASFTIRGISSDHELSRSRGVLPGESATPLLGRDLPRGG